MMWLLFMLAWSGFFAVTAVFAQQAFGYDFAGISADFLALPVTQRLATSVIASTAILLIGASVYQARKISRQQTDMRLMRDRLKGARKDAAVARGLQNHLDEVVQHLADNDLQETISSIQKELTDAEQRAALQRSRNEATDIPDQLEDIRRRQQALRETIGVVAEKRRVTEPVLAELKDRHRHLERSLSEIEVDDGNLADRLKALGQDVSVIQARLNALQESLTTLNRFKEELDKSQAELVPLRAPGVGIYALIDEVRPASE
jgi:chromosome segregation ATPase